MNIIEAFFEPLEQNGNFVKNSTTFNDEQNSIDVIAIASQEQRRRRRAAMACSQSTVERATFHLPFEIITEILLRLPVKSLLRFKSVSKTWYALIKTPNFISKHLVTHSTLNSNSLLLTTNYYSDKTQKYAISLLSHDGFSGPIDFPFLPGLPIWDPNGRSWFRIAGICNGLVCISLSRFGYPLIICNPSTRQFDVIRNSDWNWVEENIYVRRVSFGFGFHPSANDYKLIRIVRYSTPTQNDIVRADCYVMSTDTWTGIDGDKLSLFFGEMNELGYFNRILRIEGCFASVVLNGVFYWPASMRGFPFNQVFVMSFDMGNEEFRRIRTPECLDRTWNVTNWQFTELDGKLALVVSPDERGFDVWVLNEKGSSWSNQVKVGSFLRIARDMANGEDGENTVVGGGKNGELLVTERKASGDIKFFSYDTKTQETKDLYFGHIPYESCVYLCAGTLLPVMQANEIVLNK